MLSCVCDTESDWYYEAPTDFIKFTHKRRKRCCSCGELIDNDCLEFGRYREPYTDIEERIHGDEVWLANYYMCEACGEIFLNLTDVGYCIYLGGCMKEVLSEYWEITGFEPDSKGHAS